jgi:hypothetical protein
MNTNDRPAREYTKYLLEELRRLRMGEELRRLQQADCSLPDTCDSAECAEVYTHFFEDCSSILADQN